MSHFFIIISDKNSLIPLLIWSYGVALAPWMWLAEKDQQGGSNEFSLMSTFFAEVAYLVSILMILFATPTLKQVIIMFAAIMVVNMIFQLVLLLSESETLR